MKFSDPGNWLGSTTPGHWLGSTGLGTVIPHSYFQSKILQRALKYREIFTGGFNSFIFISPIIKGTNGTAICINFAATVRPTSTLYFHLSANTTITKLFKQFIHLITVNKFVHRQSFKLHYSINRCLIFLLRSSSHGADNLSHLSWNFSFQTLPPHFAPQ